MASGRRYAKWQVKRMNDVYVFLTGIALGAVLALVGIVVVMFKGHMENEKFIENEVTKAYTEGYEEGAEWRHITTEAVDRALNNLQKEVERLKAGEGNE